MALLDVRCPYCDRALQVDGGLDADICTGCSRAYVVKEAFAKNLEYSIKNDLCIFCGGAMQGQWCNSCKRRYKAKIYYCPH
ncbi:MAG: hypothetical protein FWC27_03670 [Firmicutes bacterium]|nr:hypothetical protein [Bacillota bacterium]